MSKIPLSMFFLWLFVAHLNDTLDDEKEDKRMSFEFNGTLTACFSDSNESINFGVFIQNSYGSETSGVINFTTTTNIPNSKIYMSFNWEIAEKVTLKNFIVSYKRDLTSRWITIYANHTFKHDLGKRTLINDHLNNVTFIQINRAKCYSIINISNFNFHPKDENIGSESDTESNPYRVLIENRYVEGWTISLDSYGNPITDLEDRYTSEIFPIRSIALIVVFTLLAMASIIIIIIILILLMITGNEKSSESIQEMKTVGAYARF